ncbi:MAG: phosphatidylserine decarboxylase [Thermoplasmata archaeon]|nr:MAG: phosphatidylserine decarboxylase [Thermoplasmata archaeon]
MIARGSAPLIAVPLIIAFVLVFINLIYVALIFLIIFIFFIIFFRDPERTVGDGIVSPADGRLSSIKKEGGILRLSIVMGLHNVHVNRAPFEGKIAKIEHIKGKHVPAFDKNSDANERVVTTLDTQIGQVTIVQIAGAFARRIVPYVHTGDRLSKGQRIGIIRFGSRVDLYLPKNRIELTVKEGSTVKAGVSCLAREVPDED